jgi:DNA polymerase I-like protein with 3'-5' exonuclease and polymerase domains
VVNNLHDNGFAFDVGRAKGLLSNVESELAVLDKEILNAFPPKLKLIREITPKETKHGTLSRTDFRFISDGDLSEYNGGPFCRCSWVTFNPSSHKQIISVLSGAGWNPVDKTKTHLETEREINRLKYTRTDTKEVDLTILSAKMVGLKVHGWKINEVNLSTLPETAPSPARTLAKRILLESRRRTLTEWLGLVQDDNRIHGTFYGIGAWTHRMAHQRPNTANIPNEFDTNNNRKLLGKELRSLWRAPRNRLLVGVDAEGIQLRIFAHYIDDKEFTDALVRGSKSDKTDPHSLNQRILGDVCKSRAAAKRFVYALLLGAGIGKLAEILEASKHETEGALQRLMDRYTGFTYLKENVIPTDARRGWFLGLDGRRVRIPGDTPGERKHLCMSGYLQNGEAIIMKRATLKWESKLHADKAMLVNMVHDEWQTEVPNNMEIARRIAETQALSLKEVGEELKLKCPLAGSYYNDDHHDYTIGTNWYHTH